MSEAKCGANGRWSPKIAARDFKFQISNLRFPRPQGMIGREVLGEKLLESDRTGFASLALLVVRARLIIEMTRAGDVGILQGIRPGAELPGAALGHRFQI
jgi:hypothetical protein